MDVPRSIGQISRLCNNDPFLAPIATAATTDGQRVLTLTGHEGPAGLFSREVRVSVGTCHGRGGSLVVPMEWEATHFSRLFPVLSGDLELAPLGPHSCRIILSASYAVPLGEVGRRLDRLVLHGVAESTIRSFLQRLGLALERAEASPVARAPRDDREAAVPAYRLAS